MKRKGISPLIAAVLLIAFTMAIASLFAQWAPQLMEDTMGDTDEQAADIQECSNVRVEVTKGDHNSVTIRQTAGDTRTIGNMSVTWEYVDSVSDTFLQNFTSIDDNVRGTTTTTVSPSGASSAEDVKEIVIDPLECEGSASVTYEP